MNLRPLIDMTPVPTQLGKEVLRGLLATPKSIQAKFLYDARGSELFELITALPEYYLTRSEFEILRLHAEEIAAAIGPGSVLIEFGSGSSEKVRLLLPSLRPSCYVPVDISRQRLGASARTVQREFPWLPVVPVCADYSRTFQLPAAVSGGERTAFFPGSSIGNFELGESVDFLCNVAQVVGPRGQLLIGFDLKKDPAVLERAYNDVQGVSAAFNRNVLLHLNKRFGTDFDPDEFDHRARYNEVAGRIEIHLVSRTDQTVTAFGRHIELRCGEAIHTENSYKYLPEEFDVLAEAAGFQRRAAWFDSNRRFAVFLYEVRRSGSDGDRRDVESRSSAMGLNQRRR